MEIAVIAVIALIVLGPNKLPEAAKSLGKGFREMRDSFSGAMSDEKDDDEPESDDLEANEDDDYMPEAFRVKDDAAPSEDETATLASEDEKTVAPETGSAPQGGLEEDHQNDARSSVPSASSSSTERE
jgi:sec-independent protein translocase protein TatA